MKKILAVMIFIVGIVVIGGGFFLQLSSTEKKVDSGFANFDEVKVQALNDHNLEQVCSNYNLNSDYIYDNDSKKINFKYPDCVKKYYLTNSFNQEFQNEDGSVLLNIDMNLNTNVDKSLKEFKDQINSNETYKDTKFKDGNFKVAGKTYYYVQVNTLNVDVYESIWYVVFNIFDERYLSLTLKTSNGVISFDAVKDILESFNKDSKAVKLYDKENDKYVFNLKSNNNESFEHGINVKVSIDDEFEPIDSMFDNYHAMFRYTFSNNDIYNMDINLGHLIKNNLKDLAVEYANDPKTIVCEKIAGYDACYFVDRDQNDKETGYLLIAVSDKLVYSVNFFGIQLKEDHLSSDFIKKFANFEVEEY